MIINQSRYERTQIKRSLLKGGKEKTKKTHKSTKQAVRANPNGPKRFSWTSGSGVSASRYLETRYLEWEAGDSRKRDDVIDSVSQHLLATYDITRNAGDLKHVSPYLYAHVSHHRTRTDTCNISPSSIASRIYNN